MSEINSGENSYRDLSLSGLWRNNPTLVQLLGLCPLLAVTDSLVKALGLGLVTTLVLVASNLCVSLTRRFLSSAIHLVVLVMIIAAVVSCLELLMQAFAYQLYQLFGIFLPLIATNCIILGRADGFAAKNPIAPAIVDGLMMGLGALGVMVVLGALRELAGSGALFSDMHLLLGEGARPWKVQLFSVQENFLLATLPPGAFILTGLLIALKNIIDRRFDARRKKHGIEQPTGHRRVRVTGQIS